MRNLATLALTAVLVAGCATGPTVISHSNPRVDMVQLSTFNFMLPLGTDRASGVRTTLSTMLATAMSREMIARGFRESNEPDLLINFFVNIETRMQVRQTPTMTTSPHFHSYRRGLYRPWSSYRTTVTQYERGTLNIDVVDARNMVLAWEGAAMQRLRSAEVTQQQVDEVVTQVMAEFPYRAN